MAKNTIQRYGRGHIKLPMLWGSYYVVYGGPYYDRPEGTTYGVKMAAEIRAKSDVDIPTRDFSIPGKELMDAGLKKAVGLIVDGLPLYVGCMGGIGRTGLFLAVLAKAWGVKDPVKFVRDNYYGHAVETQQQQQYIADYEVSKDIKKMILKAKIKNVFQLKNMLTHG